MPRSDGAVEAGPSSRRIARLLRVGQQLTVAAHGHLPPFGGWQRHPERFAPSPQEEQVMADVTRSAPLAVLTVLAALGAGSPRAQEPTPGPAPAPAAPPAATPAPQPAPPVAGRVTQPPPPPPVPAPASPSSILPPSAVPVNPPAP